MLEYTASATDAQDILHTGIAASEAGVFACHATLVSVVIPCFNEERFIKKVLENLARQYDAENYEIIVVDGMSTDGTRDAVQEFVAAHPDIKLRLIENAARNIPKSLNMGIKEACGEVIVRMDAHSIPSSNYVRRCVELLQSERAGIVGMHSAQRGFFDRARHRARRVASIRYR